MDVPEFLAAVRRRAPFPSAAAALRASRATLMTLGERLSGDEPHRLAAHLPPEVAPYLFSGSGRGRPLSSAEFLRRVGEREGVDPETARLHARAVVEVVHQAVCRAEGSRSGAAARRVSATWH